MRTLIDRSDWGHQIPLQTPFGLETLRHAPCKLQQASKQLPRATATTANMRAYAGVRGRGPLGPTATDVHTLTHISTHSKRIHIVSTPAIQRQRKTRGTRRRRSRHVAQPSEPVPHILTARPRGTPPNTLRVFWFCSVGQLVPGLTVIP